MPIELTLDQPKEVVVVQEQKENITDFKYLKYEDDFTEVIAHVEIAGQKKTLTLWSSETTPTYEEIGQFEDSDLIARTKQVVSEL